VTVVFVVIVVMPTQGLLEMRLSLEERSGLTVSVADLLLGLGFLLLLIRGLTGRRAVHCGPPLMAWGLAGVALVTFLTVSRTRTAAKEALQIIEYVLLAYVVLASVMADRRTVETVARLFTAVVSVVVLVALAQQLQGAAPFEVRGTFRNRNTLGAFLALALPFCFGLSLYRCGIGWRVSLWATVIVGLSVIQSGGAFLAAAAAILVVAAVRHRAALAFAALALLVMIAWMPASRRAVLLASVRPYVQNNQLLGAPELLARAEERRKAGNGAEARRLLTVLTHLEGEEWGLASPEEAKKIRLQAAEQLANLEAAMSARGELSPRPGPVVAVRYRRWEAALSVVESHPRGPWWGTGGGSYQARVTQAYYFGARPSGEQGIFPENYNLNSDEPDSFNQYLVTAVEYGLLGLVGLLGLGLTFLSRAGRICRVDDEGADSMVALAAIGGLVGFGLVSLFVDTLQAGLALPFVLVLATIGALNDLRKGWTQP